MDCSRTPRWRTLAEILSDLKDHELVELAVRFDYDQPPTISTLEVYLLNYSVVKISDEIFDIQNGGGFLPWRKIPSIIRNPLHSVLQGNQVEEVECSMGEILADLKDGELVELAVRFDYGQPPTISALEVYLLTYSVEEIWEEIFDIQSSGKFGSLRKTPSVIEDSALPVPQENQVEEVECSIGNNVDKENKASTREVLLMHEEEDSGKILQEELSVEVCPVAELRTDATSEKLSVEKHVEEEIAGRKNSVSRMISSDFPTSDEIVEHIQEEIGAAVFERVIKKKLSSVNTQQVEVFDPSGWRKHFDFGVGNWFFAPRVRVRRRIFDPGVLRRSYNTRIRREIFNPGFFAPSVRVRRRIFDPGVLRRKYGTEIRRIFDPGGLWKEKGRKDLQEIKRRNFDPGGLFQLGLPGLLGGGEL
jgi:hypothetical protein